LKIAQMMNKAMQSSSGAEDEDASG